MNILLSSIGRRSYLAEYFKEALAGNGKVIGCNCISDVPGALHCDQFELVPVCWDSDFIPCIQGICRKYSIQLLFSLHDLEGVILAENRALFENEGIRLVMANSEFMQKCLDKEQTGHFLQNNGFLFPKTYTNLSAALTAIENGQIHFPVVIKPASGFGSIGLFFAETLEELNCFYHKSRRELNNRIQTYGQRNLLSQKLLIQEKLVGDEYGLDIVNDLNGNYITTFVEKKLGMRDGETTSAVVMHHPLLETLGQRLGQITKHPGNLDVDIILQGNTPYILEMNPRFGGHYPFAHAAGANIPAAIISWVNGSVPDPCDFKIISGTTVIKDFVIHKIK